MQTVHQQIEIPPELAALASGRDFISTNEFATTLGIAPQTARKNFCLTGECYGIRPIKRGKNGRLLWPVASIAKVLNGGAR